MERFFRVYIASSNYEDGCETVMACINFEKSPSPPSVKLSCVNTKNVLYCFRKIILKNTR